MGVTILKNGRIFSPGSSETDSSDDLPFRTIILENDKITHLSLSTDDEVTTAARNSSAVTEIDLQNRIITPSFIDGHVHLLLFGLSLAKVDVLRCSSLEDIRETIKTYKAANPSVPRIVCKGWMQATTGRDVLASMLDDLGSTPIYMESFDFHSCWCNSAALEELKLEGVPDPVGGTIHRDENGKPTGLLSETAFHSIVWPFLNQQLTDIEQEEALDRAFDAYRAAGYTGFIEMAMDADGWELIQRYRAKRNVPFHMAAYWLVAPAATKEETRKNLDKAIEMNKAYPASSDPTFCIIGIKIISDGVVDSCTAALKEPYIDMTEPVPPLWSKDLLEDIVQLADAANLQIAIHAIGDMAITQAIDAYISIGPNPTRRHRIEHLELATPEDAIRLGQHGIIASVQPVHSDPVLARAWPNLIGTHRCSHKFAYSAFADAGAKLAFGTDAPTAPHLALPNLYHATTRKSVMEPESSERANPEFAISLAAAVTAATKGAAYSRYAENWTGSLEVGKSADFVVLEAEWDAEMLLKAKVVQTWYRGEKVFELDEA